MQKLSLFPQVIAVWLLTPLVCLAAGAVHESRFEPIDQKRERTVPIKVYLDESSSPRPVVLFSHGLGGSRENNSYLGKHWAEAGYAAVFMQHPGSDAEVWKSARLGEKFTKLKAAAGAESFRDRIGDVSFVIDQLEVWNRQADHPLQGKLDLDHIGMSGHSFGAVTTLAVAGQKLLLGLSFPEERIDAFLAMSPQPGKGVEPAKGFGHLTKPLLCMTGTEDKSPIDPGLTPADRREVYTALPAGDKYELVLEGAQHSAFGGGDGNRVLALRGRDPAHHPAIQKISLQFWNAYLKGDESAKKWLQSKQVVADSGLDPSDVWEWK